MLQRWQILTVKPDLLQMIDFVFYCWFGLRSFVPKRKLEEKHISRPGDESKVKFNMKTDWKARGTSPRCWNSVEANEDHWIITTSKDAQRLESKRHRTPQHDNSLILGFRIQPGPHFKPLPRNQWRLHWMRSATERLRVQRGEPADSDHKHQTKGKRQTEHKLPENLIMNLTGRKRKDGYGLRLHAAFSRTASQKSQLYNIILLNHLLIIFM